VSSQNPSGVSARLDPLPYLERMALLATTVLTEHLNVAECCTVCGAAWPCDSVRLADHNLAVL
jgi:hypothetical protein